MECVPHVARGTALSGTLHCCTDLSTFQWMEVDKFLHDGFGDGLRHFEPWSSDVDDPELAPLSPNYHSKPTGGRLSSRQI
ncbi:hypothetical protein TNCV_4599201 [Trichonephila clavipes]|nr:hypothetical protein TNCV_4599201 [Trichonephila clavipes]